MTLADAIPLKCKLHIYVRSTYVQERGRDHVMVAGSIETWGCRTHHACDTAKQFEPAEPEKCIPVPRYGNAFVCLLISPAAAVRSAAQQPNGCWNLESGITTSSKSSLAALDCEVMIRRGFSCLMLSALHLSEL